MLDNLGTKSYMIADAYRQLQVVRTVLGFQSGGRFWFVLLLSGTFFFFLEKVLNCTKSVINNHEIKKI